MNAYHGLCYLCYDDITTVCFLFHFVTKIALPCKTDIIGTTEERRSN